MALNKAIMLLLEMRESSMMPTVFKVYINDIIKTVSQCEEPSAQPETNRSVFPNNSDTISRQAAIDKITKRLYETAFNNVGIKQNIDETLVDVAENRLENWFNELPSVQPERKPGKWILDRSGAYCCSKCMEPCATYVMMKPRDRYCKMCGSRNEVME